MGKGKAKKAKPVPANEILRSPSPPLCTCGHSHEPLRAADGHNVEGWTDEDIRIYNELLSERAKLEKEKNELEQKSARHQAERALLNEDAAAFDNLFKVQLSGEYRFTGSSACCLDFSNDPSTVKNGCHHEVCSRAKIHGVSWMEMDTIKYYQARITSERSQRMKNALRKQRDVELERVKKDDDEEIALRSRRSAMLDKSNGKHEEPSVATSKSPNSTPSSPLDAFGGAAGLLDPKDSAILDAARENEVIVKKIRTRLDKIRHDVHAGRVTAFDARIKLDQANKEMAEAERKNNTFKEMIFTSGAQGQNGGTSGLTNALSKSLSSSSKDAFSQALSVMKGFFSASDPRDVQAAISDLRNVFEINGPIPSTLQKSFQALEDMLAKPNAKGFAVDLTSSDGTAKTCHNVIEVLLTLRNSADAATLEATAKELKLDKATLDANKASIQIEDAAFDKMLNTYTEKDKANCDPRQIYEAIRAIKDTAVKESFVPPLSDIVLEDHMTGLLFSQAGIKLIEESASGVDEKRLQAMMTSIVIAYSDKNPTKYLASLDRLARCFRQKRATHESSIPKLESVLEHVRSNMRKFIDNAKKKQAESSLKLEQTAVQPSLTPGPLHVSKQQENGSVTALKSPDPVVKTNGSPPEQGAPLQPPSQTMTAEQWQQWMDTQAEKLTEAITSRMPGFSAAEQALWQKNVREIIQGGDIGIQTLDPAHVARIRETMKPFAEETRAAMENKSKTTAQKGKEKGKTSKFQEELSPSTSAEQPADGKVSPPPYMANEGRALSKVKVQHFTPHKPTVVGAGPPSSSSSTPTLSVAETHGLSEREVTIMKQLHAMHVNMKQLSAPAAATDKLGSDVLGLEDPFAGITKKLQEQFDGHLAIARSFADVNGWKGLQAWMDREFK
jgi:hypothetical protein